MNLYEGVKTRERVNCQLSEEFEVKMGMHQGYVLSLYLLVVIVNVVTELAREGALSELIHGERNV